MLSCNTMFDMAATTIQRNLQRIKDIKDMILSESMITTNLTFCVVVVASAAYVCGAAKGAFTSSTADV